MNWLHLQTLIWLRWRLFRNHLRRSGVANTVVTFTLLILAGLLTLCLFVAALVVGIRMLPQATSNQVLYLWNFVTIGFLVFWTLGLATELQRSEVIALEKLLIYPITLRGAFLVNYISSFASITLIIFLPTMVGLCIASVVAIGPSMLVTLPLLAGFVLIVTALTYQLRGWLAALMVNKRRRRTILAIITVIGMTLPQLPNLLNLAYQRSNIDKVRADAQRHMEDVKRLNSQLGSRQINLLQYQERVAALDRVNLTERQDAEERRSDRFNGWVRVLDMALPPGWLAYGAMKAFERNVWPGLLGAAGFCLIGGISLRRSYQTTLRFYRGGLQTERTATKIGDASVQKKRSANLVAWKLPWVPEQAAATALATLRSMLRAPEVHILLLLPVLFLVGLVVSVRRMGAGPASSEQLRPLWALGIVVTATVGLLQLFQNQFGYDREGFRTFVLSPCSRRDILLGKNLALAPIVLGAGTVMLVVLQFLSPLHMTYFLASLFELLSAYLILCLFGNHMSILLPVTVRAGTLRSSKTTFLHGIFHLAAFVLLLIAFGPIFVPLGIDFLAQTFDWGRVIPVYLIGSVLELLALIFIYRRLLKCQGEMLQTHEQKILEVVARKNE